MNREGRKGFAKLCKHLIARQSLMPAQSEIVSESVQDVQELTAHHRQPNDLCARFILGLERIKQEAVSELVFVIENDDWYSAEYCKAMHDAWQSVGRPQLFGIGYTHYAHLIEGGTHEMQHPERASLFCTAIRFDAIDKAIAIAKTCKGNFLDMSLWNSKLFESTATYLPKQILAIGLKHGVGYEGGGGHSRQKAKYRGLQNRWLLEQIGRHDYSLYFDERNNMHQHLWS